LTARYLARDNPRHITAVEEATLMREIAVLEEQVTTLRDEEGQAHATLAVLEAKLAEVDTGIAEARRNASKLEERLEQARAELAETLAEEACRQAQDAMTATAGALADSIELVLSTLAAYEMKRGAVTDIRSQLPPSILARVGPYDVPDPAEHEAVAESWTRLVAALGARDDAELDDELVEAAARSPMGHAISALPAHLRELARRRREDHLSDLARSQRRNASGK
jgi:chromosome segregation ATPase